MSQPGLSRTTIPPTRPMPLPTVSPLCPPGAATGAPGTKPKPIGAKTDELPSSNHVAASSPASPANATNATGQNIPPVTQHLKPTIQPSSQENAVSGSGANPNSKTAEASAAAAAAAPP